MKMFVRQVVVDFGCKSYFKDKQRGIVLVVIYAIIITSLIAVVSGNGWGGGTFLLGLVIFIILFFKKMMTYQQYIYGVFSEGDVLRVCFFDRGKRKCISLEREKIYVKKRSRFSRIRDPYIVMKYGKKNIKQYNVGEWDETVMDKVLLIVNFPISTLWGDNGVKHYWRGKFRMVLFLLKNGWF